MCRRRWRRVEYAAPETPVLETVIESPGYTVPGELTFSWAPGYVPVPGATTVSEEGQMLSTEHPPPKTFLASAATPVVRKHGSVPPHHVVAPGGYGVSCGNRDCARD